MAWALAFGVLLAGYTLLDWGHYRVAHKQVTMWYLISGKGQGPTTPPQAAAQASAVAPAPTPASAVQQPVGGPIFSV